MVTRADRADTRTDPALAPRCSRAHCCSGNGRSVGRHQVVKHFMPRVDSASPCDDFLITSAACPCNVLQRQFKHTKVQTKTQTRSIYAVMSHAMSPKIPAAFVRLEQRNPLLTGRLPATLYLAAQQRSLTEQLLACRHRLIVLLLCYRPWHRLACPRRSGRR